MLSMPLKPLLLLLFSLLWPGGTQAFPDNALGSSGTNERINVPDLGFNGNTMTIETWLKPDAGQTGFMPGVILQHEGNTAGASGGGDTGADGDALGVCRTCRRSHKRSL